MVHLADLETRVLRRRLEFQPIVSPIFISGLARSGTTILLEALAGHPDVGSHQYRDYPLVLLPYAWTWLLRFMETRRLAPMERAHGDRIMVTPESPEAMEEVVWRMFFPAGAAARNGDVLDASAANPVFARFYRAHIGKVLLAREARRYLSKGNCNISRLRYIQALFPDARFIVPVRSPAAQVGSMLRQHRRFTAGLRDNPRGRAHLRRLGHFEFGPDRRPIDVETVDGVGGDAASVARLWASGDEVRGWARYWALVYGHIAQLFHQDAGLARAVHVQRYEDFCSSPAVALAAVFTHARLAPPMGLIERFAQRVSAPNYYDSGLSRSDLEVIREETAQVALRFGYGG